MNEISHVWRLVENWRRQQRFDVNQSALARDIGVKRSAVSQWKLGHTVPTPENLRGIQSATGLRYRDLLDALLQDMGYLPPDTEELMGNAQHPAAITEVKRSHGHGTEPDTGLTWREAEEPDRLGAPAQSSGEEEGLRPPVQ